MIFENVFALSLLSVMLFSFVIGFLGVFVIARILSKRNPELPQEKGRKTIRKVALLSGVSSTFFLSIVICTLTPSLITVEKDLSYTEEFAFFSNGEFLGIGGSYIANNSNTKLRLVEIGADGDINVIIPSGKIKKIRKCPEAYFKNVPERQHIRVKIIRGKRKVISGPSVYLIKY